MKRRRLAGAMPTRTLLALLVGAVIVPGVLSLSVGIIALALWREGWDIAFGVLVLCFACMAITGGAAALLYVRRTARLAEQQSEFVANVSHELRTPIAGMRLMAETLELDRAGTPEQRGQVLARLQSEIDRLDQLVDRILRWRRLEAAAGPLDAERLDVATLVGEVAARFHDRGKDAVGLHVSVGALLSPVNGDRDALTDAIANLVDNALKFGGDKGPVELVVRQGAGELLIEVRDEGPGIPEHERGRVVERFYRAALHRRSQQGTGLGLAIVDGVVRAHGGALEIASEPGIGSVFTIRLPAAARKQAHGS
jgi:signal transduction histidine kinase